MRAESGSMFPPVTGTPHSCQITPHSTWSAEWVRISACRRSQSISPVTAVPTAGTGPSTVCQISGPSLRTATTLASPPAWRRTPVSWGWPPPVA